MHARFIVLALLFLAIACGPSEKDWEQVKEKLKVIGERDLLYRRQMDSIARIEGWQSPAIEQLYDQQQKMDSVNLVDVEEIVTRFGYPARAHVGDLALVPFTVIRHASDSVMISYMEVILGAGANGDLPMNQVAIFHDRILIAQGEPQEYGTQIWIDFIVDKRTGDRYDSVYLWPVRNYALVDARRIAAGLDSMADHLRRFNIDPAQGYLLKKSGGDRR